MFWDAKISVYFACDIVLYYGILFCFGVYGVFDLFSDVVLKHLFGSEKQNKKTK
jgi:hypothetical protein